MLEPAKQPKGFAMVRGRLIKSGSRGKWSVASRERSRARRERARRLLPRLLVLLVVLLRVAVTVAVAVTAAAILATGETRFAGVTCRQHHPVHTPDTVHAPHLYAGLPSFPSSSRRPDPRPSPPLLVRDVSFFTPLFKTHTATRTVFVSSAPFESSVSPACLSAISIHSFPPPLFPPHRRPSSSRQHANLHLSPLRPFFFHS